MRMNQRTLSAAVFAGVLMLSVSACKKKVPAPPPPPPPKIETPGTPAAPAARITNFSAEPRAIQTGQSATLTWAVANATDISINNGIGSVAANGTRQVFPTSTTTYTLTASSAGGNDIALRHRRCVGAAASAAASAATAQGFRYRHVQQRYCLGGRCSVRLR